MTGHWFSPLTARTTLQRVRPTIERIRDVYRAMQDMRPGRPGSDCPVEPRYFDLVVRLHLGVGELQRVGVVVKDLAAGRIDFPSRRDGRPVLLSWQLGDPAIGYWREVDDDDKKRRPVDVEGPWDSPPLAARALGGKPPG